MDGLPVTRGYTINVVKEKSKSAIIFLSPPGKVAVTLSSENKNVDNYIVPEILASNSIIKTNARALSPSESYTRETDNSVSSEASDNADQVLFYEEVLTGPGDGNVQFFSDVAHEEVVVEEEDAHEAGVGQEVYVRGEVPVHCDLCNSVFSPMEDIKAHMISAHNMLSFEGGCTATVYVYRVLLCILCRSVLQVRLLLCVRDGPREPHEEGALLGPGQHLHQAGQQLPLQTVQLHQRPAHQHQVSSNRPSVD